MSDVAQMQGLLLFLVVGVVARIAYYQITGRAWQNRSSNQSGNTDSAYVANTCDAGGGGCDGGGNG